MSRQRAREVITDFTFGQDSSSYDGVLDPDLQRYPLLQNIRIRDNGKCTMRGGIEQVTEDDLGEDRALNALFELPDDNLVRFLYAAYERAVLQTTSCIFKYTAKTGLATEITDYSVVPKLLDLKPGRKFAADKQKRLYIGGNHNYNPAVGDYHGVIIDPANDQARNWGIEGPPVTPTINVGSVVGDVIPAPLNGGWEYYYTYIRIDGTELVAESTPSPQPLNRFNPGVDCKHDVVVAASTDPQVTNIRIYRTTGNGPPPATPGFLDGTATNTASEVVTVPNANDTITVDYLQPALIANILETFGYYPYKSANSPLPAQGKICVRYKDRIIVGGEDSRIYFTDARTQAKFKAMFNFASFAEFHKTVTAIFVHENDIIVATFNDTWRIVDGDLTGGTAATNSKRLASDGIGIVAPNSVVYDAQTKRTLALTNKGVRAWTGSNWSEDLSYQIRSDIENAIIGAVQNDSTFEAIAGIVNREYHLSFRGDVTGSANARTIVGYLKNDMSIAWTVDKTNTLSYFQGKLVPIDSDNGNRGGSYREVGYNIMRVDINGTGGGLNSVNRLCKIDQITEYFDFLTSKIEFEAQLPRLKKNSTDNLRVRSIRIEAFMRVPESVAGVIPYITIIGTGDNGRTVSIKKAIQDAVSDTELKYLWSDSAPPAKNNARYFDSQDNPLALTGHYVPYIIDIPFDNLFAKSFIDLVLKYDSPLPFEFNSAEVVYIFRDRLV